MKSKIHIKILSLAVVFSLLLSLTSCVFDTLGENIADAVIDQYNPSSGNGSNSSNNTLYDDELGDDVLLDDVLNDEVLKEHIIRETLIEELYLYEIIRQEDVRIESVSVSVYNDFQEFDYDFVCESNLVYEFDYSLIRERIADGASMVIAEVVIDLGSFVLDVCCGNWVEAAIDAAQILYTTVGTTLAAYIAGEAAKAKSLAAGNSYEVVVYDSLDAASSAFYYTAVVCDVVNTAISLGQLAVSIAQIVKDVKRMSRAMKQGSVIADASGSIAASKIADDVFVITQNGKTVKCMMAANSTDLYDIATKEYVCSLVKYSDDVVALESKTIPSQIYTTRGTLKYECENGQIWRMSTKNGESVRGVKPLGNIDPAGYVWSGGKIVDHIDFATGTSLNAYRAIANAGENISVDLFGDLIDVSSGTKLTKQTVDGVVTYFDYSSKAVLKEYVGTDGFTYLKRIGEFDNGKVVGKLTADGKFDVNWCVELNKIRTEATQKIRGGLVRFIQENPVSVIRDKFPQLDDAQITYIKEFGRVPTSIQIHHCKNVANYPDLAGDLTNLEVMTYDGHLAAHNFNFKNSTSARSKNYIDLKKLFGLE